jgi:hypothetical protein
MSRRVIFALCALLAAIGLALLITYLQRVRLNANVAASRNNLRDLAFFAAHHANPDPKTDPTKLPKEIPAGTVVLAGVPPENRLSWAVSVLPALDQKKHPAEQLLAQIKTDQPWLADANQQAARTRLPVFLCPENTPKPPPDAPAPTCYVGVAGLGADAATLMLPPNATAPPRAGAWRYDSPTPFDKIADGLSQTLLLGETANEPGPWLRGGHSTVRGFDDSPGAKPLIGAGGQFGGFFPNAAHFALCDGSVRAFTPQTTPSVLLKLATIAGGDEEVRVPD